MKINYLLLRLTREKYINRWVILLIDLFLSVFSTITSLALISYILDCDYSNQVVFRVFLASAFCSIVSFFVCQTYKGIIRHSAFTETGRIAMASSLKVAIVLPVLFLLTETFSFRSFLLGSVIDFFLTFFILTIFRVFLITGYTFMISSMTSRSKDKLLVFGHEKSSPAFLNDSFLRENSSYQVEGFLRFGPRISMRIGIYKVYFVSDQAEFNRLVNRYNIKAILFTDYKVVKEESERLVRFCEKKKIRMLLLPSIDELQGGKYVNSETGGLYRKSELLYGLYEARKAICREGSVFLVEGYKDVLAMHAAGFRHTVALCGTALCTGHIALLKRYTTSVRVMLDADKAGRKAADAVVPVLAGEGMEAVRIGLPEGDDPDSLFRRLGREAFAAYVREAVRQTRPSEEQVLLGRIRKGIGLLSGVAEAEKRERLLRVLEDCLTQLKGLSVGACRPATMDWRWV